MNSLPLLSEGHEIVCYGNIKLPDTKLLSIDAQRRVAGHIEDTYF